MTQQVINYNQDFYAWAMRNATLIRQGHWQEIDVEHVAEELEGMGRSERNEFMSRCAVLLAHLLKWQFQSRKQSRSWRLTIEEQRLQIKQLLLENSSFYHQIEDKIAQAYAIGLIQAQKQTHLSKSHFPDSCPYNLSELLDETFYPTPTDK